MLDYTMLDYTMLDYTMLDYSLSTDQCAELEEAHRRMHDKREADCLKVVLALATGWSPEEVADMLRVDPNTVRNDFKRYRAEGIEGEWEIPTNTGRRRVNINGAIDLERLEPVVRFD